ncbi:MAG TPA: FkbM family methyltransferase, partial [Deltaproteobacteria bacterium]|nr:FkbM family methyltransferase [Deltaproteobacteria bacterium]
MKKLLFNMARETELEKWRADTFWTKEPETIAWIDSFGPGFFWDVGANVGIYSLYAAVRHPDTVKVYAFEPYPDNFVALKGNIAANGLGGAVRPVLAALGREEGFNYFYSPRAGRGVSGGQVGLPIDE